MIPTHPLLAAIVLAAAPSLAWAGDRSSAACIHAAAAACQARHSGDKPLSSCLDPGLRQCLPALSDRSAQSATATRRAAGDFTAPLISSSVKCGNAWYTVSTGTSAGQCTVKDLGSAGIVHLCQDGVIAANAGMAWCAADRPDACAAPAGHLGKGSCTKRPWAAPVPVAGKRTAPADNN